MKHCRKSYAYHDKLLQRLSTLFHQVIRSFDLLKQRRNGFNGRFSQYSGKLNTIGKEQIDRSHSIEWLCCIK
ncbi:hypothetical protein CGJ97_23515 [Vibrio parahaemolyticus]|nr:hypothetical protein CGJ97_23515 [Vibrio parahaemolyticus]